MGTSCVEIVSSDGLFEVRFTHLSRVTEVEKNSSLVEMVDRSRRRCSKGGVPAFDESQDVREVGAQGGETNSCSRIRGYNWSCRFDSFGDSKCKRVLLQPRRGTAPKSRFNPR